MLFRSRRHPGFPNLHRTAILLLLAAGTAGMAIPAAAQVHPPKQGVSLPEAYLERLREDRTAFQFQRAWQGETRRVQNNRRLRDLGVLSASDAGVSFRVEGVRRVPVIAGKFNNTPSDPYSITDLQEQLFDGPNPTGTITDFYDEISYGYLDLQGDVHGDGNALYEVSGSDTYYEGGCNGLCGAAKTGEYLQELLDLSDGTVDFSQYDNDGPDGIANSGDDDGYVDFVAFVHPENGGECGTTNLWSHRWVYEAWWGVPYVTDDPAAGGGFIRISDYTIQPLLSCNGSDIIEIGVYAHEFGHAFDLPDLYDTNSANGTSQGVGEWCLMGSGSYGGDGVTPETPAHMSAWCKEQLGWIEPQVLCADMTGVQLSAAAAVDDVLKVYPDGIAGPEYFLVENRVKTGFDSSLRTSGLAVWHIDERNPGNGDEDNKLVDLEEADGLYHLDNNINRSDAGDLYPGSTNQTEFTDATDPNSRDNAGLPSGFALTSIDGTVDPRGFDVTVPECRLRLADAALDDGPCGNNNKVLDDFERAEVAVCLTNDFDTLRTGVYGKLTSLTAGVTVLRDSVFFGNLDCGEVLCPAGTYEIEATGALAPGSAIDVQLDLTGTAYASTTMFRLYAGEHVLLVEDDGSATNEGYFTSPIANAGRDYAHVDTGTDGFPTTAQLAGARAVVWYTGEEYEATLSAEEQALLQSHLDQGGALFVTGQDIGYDLVSQGNLADLQFYQDYLHADYLSDDSGDDAMNGVGGDPIGGGVALDLTGGANNSTFPSVIAPRTGATTILTYTPSGGAGAVRRESGHKLVYMAFCFESNDTPDQDLLMQRILDWLEPPDVTPPSMTLDGPTGGETFTNCDSIPVTWTASDLVGVTEVNLALSDDGGQTYAPLAGPLPNTGSYSWDAGALTGSTFRIKAVAADAAELQGVDMSSSDFTITGDTGDPFADVLEPNGGESYITDDVAVLSWAMDDSCSAIDSTKVWVSIDGGGSWEYAGSVPGPDTTLAWNTGPTASDSCLVAVTVCDASGNAASDTSDAFFAISDPLGVADGFAGRTTPALLPGYPNPFRGAARLSFYLPEAGEVALRIYDLSGRLVRTMVDGAVTAGVQEVVWDGATDAGRRAGAGLYFYVLESAQGRLARKLVKTE